MGGRPHIVAALGCLGGKRCFGWGMGGGGKRRVHEPRARGYPRLRLSLGACYFLLCFGRGARSGVGAVEAFRPSSSRGGLALAFASSPRAVWSYSSASSLSRGGFVRTWTSSRARSPFILTDFSCLESLAAAAIVRHRASLTKPRTSKRLKRRQPRSTMAHAQVLDKQPGRSRLWRREPKSVAGTRRAKKRYSSMLLAPKASRN